ncbi:putative ribonuclease H-like domain-containing protein [Tanacetum coccineum]
MSKNLEEYRLEEPNKVIHALKDPRYTQEEGIDYDEVFALVARIVAITLFLAYASFKNFMVYQIDVKSAFLYGKIKEELYVCQPPRFKDPNFPDRVYKVEKALYRLHQALRAWYETLSTYLLENRFQRRTIDKTLFIKRHKGDILLIQVYVDDIIFGSTKKELCNAFEKLMHEKFQMSSMGELKFFLRLQKFGFTEVKTASTLMETHKPLLKDEDGEDVDVHMYRYQVNPKASHLHAMKRILSFEIADTHNMVAFLEKPTESVGFKEIVDFLNAHPIRYALTVNPTIYVSCIEQWSTAKTKTINKETQYTCLYVDGKKIVITNQSVRRDLQLADEEGGGPGCQETIRDIIAQTRFENVSKTSSNSLLAGVNTPRSDEDSLKLKELIELSRVASSGEESLGEDDASKQGRKIVDIDADEGVTLVDETVENHGRFNDEEMFDVGVLDSEEVFASVEQEVVAVKEVHVEEVVKVVSTAEVTTTGIEVTTVSATTTTANDLTLAQTLMEIRSARPKSLRSLQRRKNKIRLDEEAAQRLQTKLQAELEEEDMLAREKEEEANIALIESWDNVQATIDADYQMAEQLKAQEQEEAEEKRNKPPTKSQQRSIMCTYLKNIEGYKPKSLKNKSFDAIQKLLDRAYKRVNTFEDFKTELVEGSEKRAGEELM